MSGRLRSVDQLSNLFSIFVWFWLVVLNHVKVTAYYNSLFSLIHINIYVINILLHIKCVWKVLFCRVFIIKSLYTWTGCESLCDLWIGCESLYDLWKRWVSVDVDWAHCGRNSYLSGFLLHCYQSKILTMCAWQWSPPHRLYPLGPASVTRGIFQVTMANDG